MRDVSGSTEKKKVTASKSTERDGGKNDAGNKTSSTAQKTADPAPKSTATQKTDLPTKTTTAPGKTDLYSGVRGPTAPDGSARTTAASQPAVALKNTKVERPEPTAALKTDLPSQRLTAVADPNAGYNALAAAIGANPASMRLGDLHASNGLSVNPADTANPANSYFPDRGGYMVAGSANRMSAPGAQDMVADPTNLAATSSILADASRTKIADRVQPQAPADLFAGGNSPLSSPEVTSYTPGQSHIDVLAQALGLPPQSTASLKSDLPQSTAMTDYTGDNPAHYTAIPRERLRSTLEQMIADATRPTVTNQVAAQTSQPGTALADAQQPAPRHSQADLFSRPWLSSPPETAGIASPAADHASPSLLASAAGFPGAGAGVSAMASPMLQMADAPQNPMQDDSSPDTARELFNRVGYEKHKAGQALHNLPETLLNIFTGNYTGPFGTTGTGGNFNTPGNHQEWIEPQSQMANNAAAGLKGNGMAGGLANFPELYKILLKMGFFNGQTGPEQLAQLKNVFV